MYERLLGKPKHVAEYPIYTRLCLAFDYCVIFVRVIFVWSAICYVQKNVPIKKNSVTIFLFYGGDKYNKKKVLFSIVNERAC